MAAGFRSTKFNIGATSSYALVLVLLTLGIPYGTFSALLQNVGTETVISLARAQFIDGFRIGCVILAGVTLSGIIPSLLRGGLRLGKR